MALVAVRLPAGDGYGAARVTKLFSKENDRVTNGMLLARLETMKCVFDISAPCDGTVKSLKKEGDSVEFGFNVCQIDTGTTCEQQQQATANPFLPRPPTVAVRRYTPRSANRSIRFLSTSATDPSSPSPIQPNVLPLEEAINERKTDPTMLFLRKLAESTTILESNATNILLRGSAMEIKYPELIGSNIFGPQVSFPKAIDFGVCRLQTSNRILGPTHDVWANNSNFNLLAERQFKHYNGRWKKYDLAMTLSAIFCRTMPSKQIQQKLETQAGLATWARNLLQAYNTEDAAKESGIGMFDRCLFYGAAGGATYQQKEFYKFLQLTYDTPYAPNRYHMLTQAIIPDFNLICKWHLTARSRSGFFSREETSDLRAAFSEHFINLKPHIFAPQTHRSQPIKSPTH